MSILPFFLDIIDIYTVDYSDSNIITTIAPLLQKVISEILPFAVQLLQKLLPVISEIASAVLPAAASIINAILPVLATLIESLLPLLTSLLQAIMPIIQALLPIISLIASQVLPVVVEVLEMLMPLITMLIQTVLPVLTTILQALAPVIQVLAELFGGVLGSAIQAIMPVIQALTGILQGLIDFVTGVFSGDWSKAWEGIKNIFQNIVNGIVAIFKIPINGIIDLINLFLGGLNKLKIPDWVPGVGGMGINIPLIPKFEKGSNSTPDTFIAGDVNGKGGELVTGARGRKVFTAAQTTAIFDNINRAKAINSAEQNAPHPATIIERVGGFIGAVKNAAVDQFSGEAAKPNISAIPTSSGEIKIEINYNPTIYVEGDKPGDLEEKLKQNNEKLMQMFKEFLRQERENERRMSFA